MARAAWFAVWIAAAASLAAQGAAGTPSIGSLLDELRASQLNGVAMPGSRALPDDSRGPRMEKIVGMMESHEMVVRVYPEQGLQEAGRIVCAAINCYMAGSKETWYTRLIGGMEESEDARGIQRTNVQVDLVRRGAAVGTAIVRSAREAPGVLYDMCYKLGCTPAEFQTVTEEYHAQSTRLLLHETDMHDMGIAAWTDKVFHHGYDRYYMYPMHLRHLRFAPISMLEIGFFAGGSSVFWRAYFPRAERLVFIEYDNERTAHCLQGCPIAEPEIANAVLYTGDQANVGDLDRIVQAEGRRYDFIIDDGGHTPYQQLVSFTHLFVRALHSGGVYIIEDIETSYWSKATEESLASHFAPEFNIMRLFKQVADVVNRRVTPADVPPVLAESAPLISTITFVQNAIIITKRLERHNHFHDSPYHLADHL